MTILTSAATRNAVGGITPEVMRAAIGAFYMGRAVRRADDGLSPQGTAHRYPCGCPSAKSKRARTRLE